MEISKKEYETVRETSLIRNFERVGDSDIKYTHFEDSTPIGWRDISFVKLDKKCSNKDKQYYPVRFTLPVNYNQLEKCTQVFYLPALSLKADNVGIYRFKWREFLGYYSAVNSEFTNKTTMNLKLNSLEQIILFSKLTRKGEGKIQANKMGFKTANAWSVYSKPEYKLFFQQQYSHCHFVPKAHEIDMTLDMPFSYKYDLDLNTKNLIVMQRFDNGSWVNMDTDLSLFIDAPDKLETPDMIAQVSNYGNDIPLLEHRKECNEKLITDMHRIEIKDHKSPGETFTVELPFAMYGTVLCIFALLQRVDDKYIDFTDDNGTGIESISKKTQNADKYKEIPGEYFESQTSGMFQNFIHIPGLLVIPYTDMYTTGNCGGSAPQKLRSTYMFTLKSTLSTDTKYKLNLCVMLSRRAKISSKGTINYID